MFDWLFSICVHVCHVYWHQDAHTYTPSNSSQHRCDAQTINPCVVHHDGEAGACGGILIRELWRWQGPSLLSVQPSGETFSVRFNSRLTSLSGSGIRRQTCKDLDQQQLVWNKSLIYYNAAENQPLLISFQAAFLFMKFKISLTSYAIVLWSHCIHFVVNYCCINTIWQSKYGRSVQHVRKFCTSSLPAHQIMKPGQVPL